MQLSQETMCCDFETQKTWNEMEKTPSNGDSESQPVSAQPKKKGKVSTVLRLRKYVQRTNTLVDV